jgi:SDR family mycofactocin-dependent oxidoreductase
MNSLDGKVAFITGAARGQGRSHALRLAREGARIAAVDIAEPLPSVPYPGATAADLRQTIELVGQSGGQAIAIQADVRDSAAMDAAASSALAAFGRIDVVCANAGIVSGGASWRLSEQQWRDVIDVNLTGVWHTTKAVIPAMIEAGRGGSIIITSSIAGLRGSRNISHYAASKHGVVGLMRALANEVAPYGIRVNSVHPTTVATEMVLNEPTYRLFRPDVVKPTLEDTIPVFRSFNLLDVPWVEAIDVSNAVAWLASDEARYVTGVALPVDAGASVRA